MQMFGISSRWLVNLTAVTGFVKAALCVCAGRIGHRVALVLWLRVLHMRVNAVVWHGSKAALLAHYGNW